MTTKEAKTTTIQTEIPNGLLTQAQDLVAAGWFRNLDELNELACIPLPGD